MPRSLERLVFAGLVNAADPLLLVSFGYRLPALCVAWVLLGDGRGGHLREPRTPFQSPGSIDW